MKASECVKLAREVNKKLIKAKKEGFPTTASFCKELRQIYMMHAARAWIAGR